MRGCDAADLAVQIVAGDSGMALFSRLLWLCGVGRGFRWFKCGEPRWHGFLDGRVSIVEVVTMG